MTDQQEHLVSAVPETSPLWHSNVLSVRPRADGLWVIEHRSCRLFRTRWNDWMPDIHNAAGFPEEKALRLANGFAVGLITQGMSVAETLRGARGEAAPNPDGYTP